MLGLDCTDSLAVLDALAPEPGWETDLALFSSYSVDLVAVAELATRCRNTCRVPADPSAPALSVLTEPTPTQRRATHLIETFPVPGAPES